MRKTISVIVVAFLLGGPLFSAPQPSKDALLKLPIFPVRLTVSNVPLPRALEQVGVMVRQGFVTFGIEIRTTHAEEPKVNLDIAPGSTLGDALHQIVDQLPQYRYEVVSDHFINIFPIGADNDQENLLNLKVPAFDVDNVPPGNILSRPQDYIPALRDRLTLAVNKGNKGCGYMGPGIHDAGPGVTLHMKDVSVRQILTGVSKAINSQLPSEYTPLGWTYVFGLSATGAPVNSWSVHHGAPEDWKQISKALRKENTQQ